MSDKLIRMDKYLFDLERNQLDVTAIPPDASVISERDWEQMLADAGGEAELIAGLELEDMRNAAD